jgi:hypothetical protein
MFVLHVGPHKTATTWMQHNFHANARALEDAGWLYPMTGERVRVAHHDISDNPAEILDDLSAKVAEVRAIAQKAREHGLNVLMSSEGFRNWKPVHLLKLKALVGQDMRLVYCVRDPASLVYSFWAQQIKTGQKVSFPAWRDQQFRFPMKSRILNPLVELDVLAALPEIELSVLAYDEIRRQKRDIFDVFVSDVLDLAALPHVEENGAVNDRLPIELAEFMRLMLIRAGRWRDHSDVNIGRVFQYMLTDATRQEIVRAVTAVTSARRESVIVRDQPTLRKIERLVLKSQRGRMIPSFEGERLFLDGEQTCIYYDEQVLMQDPAVAELLERLSHAFRPGSVRLWLVNRSRAGLTFYRRIVKRLRG